MSFPQKKTVGVKSVRLIACSIVLLSTSCRESERSDAEEIRNVIGEPAFAVAAVEGGMTKGQFQSLAATGNTTTDHTHYKLTPILFKKSRRNTYTWKDELHIAVATANEQAIGLRLYGIKVGSTWEQLGFASGDIVTQINEAKLTDMATSLNLVGELKGAKQIHIKILRKGIEQALNYKIQ